MWRRLLGATTGVLLVLSGITASTQPAARADWAPQDSTDPATPATVTADALPTAQIDGVVWSQAVVGNRVYVGGSFANARPAGAAPGTNQVARSNLMAYDIDTGVLVASFAPTLNGEVRSVTVSPDQSRIYVGGGFTSVNGQTRNRIAAFDAATGALVAGFAPPVNYDVLSVVATNSTVYAGGDFQSVGTHDRGYLAAVNASNGALLDWAPQAAGGKVSALALSPDATKVAVGGQFSTLNGSANPGYGLGMVDAVTGASLPMAINSVVRDAGDSGGITTLSSDGVNIYGGAYRFGGTGGNFEGSFAASWNGGTTRWINDCHGDTYSVYHRSGALYVAGHSHYCGTIDGFPQTTPDWTIYRGIAVGTQATGLDMRDPYGYGNFAGQPHSSMLTWFPLINAGTYTGQHQGPWSAAGNANYVVYGGEFTKVNNKAQQGLVRFPAPALSPKAQGPSLFGTTYPLNVSSTEAGKARVNWTTNQDIDNGYLSYKVYRDVQTNAGLVYQTNARADFWAPYTMGFTDSGLDPGSSHQYRVAVTDPAGNIANSPWTTITVAASGADSSYVKAVYNSQPVDYWRFGEAGGTSAADRVGFTPVTTGSGVTHGTTGAIAGDADKAATFGGTSSGIAYSTKLVSPPNVFTIEGWFRTSTSVGGKLVGFGDAQTSSSGKNDRQIYMDNSGHLLFGVNNGSRQVLTSASTYRNNAWHYVVGTLTKAGMKLYVDGNLVGSRTDVTFGLGGYWGYWRIGGDNLSSWPSRPSSDYFSGSLDEIAIYHRELSSAEVTAHYNAGIGTNVAPTAAFTSAVSNLSVSVDGSSSFDSDGAIASYAWDFGDGGTATGATAGHTYAAGGTYSVKLTVTDNRGATNSLTKQVTVSPANVAPTAAFTSSANYLAVSVDGSGSSDSDGAVASYAWDFGDGGTATGATAGHTYAAAGAYNVTLTVTDDKGATGSLTKQVTVANAPAPFALDAFARTVTGGWGTADLGGAWTRTGSSTNFNVAGGVGTIRMGSPGAGPRVDLTGVSSANSDVRIQAGIDKPAAGGPTTVTVEPRVITGGDGYTADLRYLVDGSLVLNLGRRVGTTGTVLRSTPLTGLSLAAGERLNIRVQAAGTSPTTLRAKVWKTGTTEPAAWTASVTDSAASLQAAGGLGLATYLASTATNAPVVASFADLWAGPAE